MDHEEAIQHLGAENIALQTLVAGLMNALVADGREPVVKDAFDRADQALESAVMALGENSPPWYTRRALEVLDQYRALVFPRK